MGIELAKAEIEIKEKTPDPPPTGWVSVPLAKGIIKQPSGELALDFEWCKLPVYGTTSIECSAEDHTPESTPVQFLAAWPPATPPLHGCGWPLAAPPPTNVREWETLYKMKWPAQRKWESIHSGG